MRQSSRPTSSITLRRFLMDVEVRMTPQSRSCNRIDESRRVTSQKNVRGNSVLAASDDAVSAGCRTHISTFIDGSSDFQNGSVSALRGSFHAHGSCPLNSAMTDCAAAVMSGDGRRVAGGENQLPELAASSRSLTATKRRFSQKPSVLLMLAGIS